MRQSSCCGIIAAALSATFSHPSKLDELMLVEPKHKAALGHCGSADVRSVQHQVFIASGNLLA